MFEMKKTAKKEEAGTVAGPCLRFDVVSYHLGTCTAADVFE